MQHTKFLGHSAFGSGEDLLKFLQIYGHGGHLGHVTWSCDQNHLNKLSFSHPIEAHLKSDID